MRFVASLILALASAMALPAAAQEIPGRVGRVAHIEGSVALYQDPEEGWERAFVNSPFTSENSVWTDRNSRAELRVGGTALRLDEGTQVDIGQLAYEELDAYVPRGTVAVRVRHYDRDERIAFTTPHARFVIRANGRYRVDVDPDREESRLTVFNGEARVGSESGRVRVGEGQTVRIFGGAESQYVVERAFNDPFDRWSRARDERWVESRSVNYVSPYMTGYEDLDRYGQWHEEPEFGALWYPTSVAADWAPYRYGRWDYVRPWGYTWVDDSPWGYAPFHYGRWVNVNNRWGWAPGPREVRPVWAPALVAFVGGSNFSVGISTGGPAVGWYPLSPWDRYQPWYNASPTYVNQINVIVRNDRPQRDDRRRWHEHTRERGVTVVNREALLDRRPVQQAVIRTNPDAIRQAAAANVTQPAQVLPTRQEVVQRRAAVRTQSAQTAQPAQAAPGKQRNTAAATAAGVAAGAAAIAAARSAARPEFQRARQAPPQAARAPEPAKAAPPPAQRVTAPAGAGQTQQAREGAGRGREPVGTTATEEQRKAREAEIAKSREQPNAAARPSAARTREEQMKAREDQAKAREAQQAGQQRERAEQQQAREQQATKAREDQAKAREAQSKAREDQSKAREAQQAEQQRQRGEQQQAREAQQRQQQQQSQERATQQQQQAQERAAREQQQQQQAQQRQQQQAQQREQQQQQQAQQRAQQQQQAQERAEKQQQQRAQQPQQAQERAQAQQQQAQQRTQQQQQQAQERAQQQKAQPPAQRQQQERGKTREEREKEEEEKKAKGR